MASKGVRRVFTELRRSSDHGARVKDLKISQYIMEQYRKHQLTEKQYCKAAEEMNHLASSYATYLSSQRNWQKVHQEYHSSGERSVEDTAKMVGFKLPHDPK